MSHRGNGRTHEKPKVQGQEMRAGKVPVTQKMLSEPQPGQMLQGVLHITVSSGVNEEKNTTKSLRSKEDDESKLTQSQQCLHPTGTSEVSELRMPPAPHLF